MSEIFQAKKKILSMEYNFIYWGGGVVNTLEHRGHYSSRSREPGVPNGSARLNTRMSADVHVIPACHGSAASTDFPLFVHRHNCADVYIHRFAQHLRHSARNVSLVDLIPGYTIRDIREKNL